MAWRSLRDPGKASGRKKLKNSWLFCLWGVSARRRLKFQTWNVCRRAQLSGEIVRVVVVCMSMFLESEALGAKDCNPSILATPVSRDLKQ